MNSSEASRTQSAAKPKIVSGAALGALEEAIQRSIALRAYDVYQSRGRSHGNDLQDWFAAEHELVKPENVHISDAGRELRMSAGVRGFSAADLQIGVSRRRFIVWGEASRHLDGCPPARMLGEIDLPAEISPSTASATLSGGILEVHADKVA